MGDLLPGYFAGLGLRDINVFQNDRPAPLYPPYASPDQTALIEKESQWKNTDTGPWNQANLRQLFLQGGGSETAFESAFADTVQKYQNEQRALAAGRFHTAGGTLSYLVSARKP